MVSLTAGTLGRTHAASKSFIGKGVLQVEGGKLVNPGTTGTLCVTAVQRRVDFSEAHSH